MLKKLLKTPLLPDGKAVVAVSQDAENVISALKSHGIDVIPIPINPKLEQSVASHADCNILQLDENTIICDETVSTKIRELLNKFKIVNYLTIGQKESINNNEKVNVVTENITSPYPSEVKINVKRTNKGIVCNTKYVSDYIKNYAEINNIELVHCNQGYVGCSSVLLNDNSVMTDDESVYFAFHRIGFDCLMLSKSQIKLSGHSYGFIGGCCGFIDKNLLAFTGKLSTLNDVENIKSFLNKHNISYIELTDEPLTDVGGIVPIFEEV